MSEINHSEREVEHDDGNIFQRTARFYRQVVAELRKVVWPSRKQLTTYTAVVRNPNPELEQEETG